MTKARVIAVATFIGLLVTCRAATGKAQPLSIPHPADTTKNIEYFVRKPAGKGPWPTVVLLHGHQNGLRRGGQDFVSWGVLDRWAQRGYLAVAISQPGYGRSSGPPDFCGPLSQRAVSAVIATLTASGESERGKIVIEGISRGALVAGLLAQTDSSIAGVVLVSGLFDLPGFAAKADTLEGKLVSQSMRTETGGEDRELVARSMLRSAAKIHAKVLILNGGLDDRTSPDQALQLANQIRSRGGEARAIVYPNYGHHIPVAVRDAVIDPFIEGILGR